MQMVSEFAAQYKLEHQILIYTDGAYFSQWMHQGGTSIMENVKLNHPSVWSQQTKKLPWTLKQTKKDGLHLGR